MASIKRRSIGWTTKTGKARTSVRYQARYRDADDKEHAKLFIYKRDAQKWLDEQAASIMRGEWVDPANSKVTFAAYAAKWERIQVASEGTKRIVDNAIRVHILPVLGDRRLGTIRRSDVQAFVKLLEAKEMRPASEGRAPRTMAPRNVRNIYEVLARILNDAADDRLIVVSPCKRISLPKDHDDEVTVPGVEVIETVRAKLSNLGPDGSTARWDAIPVVLAGSGLRIGELLGLRVSDVDFLRRTIRVERQRLQSNELSPLKTKSSRRVVPVGQVVIDALAAHLKEFPPAPDALFTDESGRALTYRRWKRLMHDASEAAGVDMTSHDLRHFAASALISGGASVKQVQAFLGHASAVITLRTYAHLFPGDEDRTRNLLDAALSPLADSTRTVAAPS